MKIDLNESEIGFLLETLRMREKHHKGVAKRLRHAGYGSSRTDTAVNNHLNLAIKTRDLESKIANSTI